MKSGKYDIQVDQGSTFVFHITYQNSTGVAIDLASYTAAMQVRRSVIDTDLILDISSTSGVTGGGTTGEFISGVSGPSGGGSASLTTSGITLNGTTAGLSSNTGGIYFEIDADTMKYVPSGKHVYDIELTTSGTVHKILSGRFEVEGEVTR